ncbi:transmembrane protein, putative, partial [Bodo saltans]
MVGPRTIMMKKWRPWFSFIVVIAIIAIVNVVLLRSALVDKPHLQAKQTFIAVVNGARPEHGLGSTLRLMTVRGNDQQRSADFIVVVFADKREYDTAASQLGGAHFPRCDIMVAWLGCRPLQILQAFGIRKTGEIIETFASTTSTVDRCH